MSSEQKWNIKDKYGQITEPLSTTQVLTLISQGKMDGREQISSGEPDRWIPISKYPEFYDAILDQQKKSLEEVPDPSSEEETPKSPSRRGRVIVEESQSLEPISQEPQRVSPPVTPTRADTNTIDLVSKKSVQKKHSSRNFLFFIVALSLGLYFVFFSDPPQESKSVGEFVHLRGPRGQREEIPPQEFQKQLQRALQYFQRDTFEGYFQTQNILSSILESNPSAPEAISLLCLTYRELWPYVYKDSQDLQTLTATVQMAQKINSMDIHGTTCRVIQAFLVGSHEAATDMVTKAISDFPTAAALYELRADSLSKNNQKNPAIAYLQKTQNLWSGWLKPFYEEARIRSEIKDYSNAIRILKNILKVQPEHDKARIEMGVIELSHFSNERGIDHIQVGLKNDKIPSPLKVRGYFALANYYLQSDRRVALQYAQKAYALDPKNSALRKTILMLGGEKALESVQSKDTQLMVVGETYFRNKNYLAAQAEFKTAFEINPKNAMAAFKASESLWKLNQTEDAMKWLHQSIKADPKFIEGYVKLADYSAQKFDFKAAAEYLTRAQSEGRNNYIVYRGYAQLELRRHNIQEAIKRAEQALSLYDSDIESLITLAKGHEISKDYEKAFQYSSKALSIDANNIQAHEVYAESLLGLRGIHPAVQYLNDKIATFPNSVDYRVLLGAIYLKDERFSEAERVLSTAVEFDPKNYRAFMLLSQAYMGQQRLNLAIRSVLKAATLDPSNAAPLFELGLIYMKDPKTRDRALRNFKKVIEVNSRYPKAFYMAGKVALDLNNKPLAMEYAETEKKMNPALADPYILMADILFSEGDYNRAVAELRRAVQIRPEDSNLYVQMARCHRQLGQLDVADAMLRTALSKESGNPEIYREQGYVFEKKGDMEAALASFSRYLEIQPNADDKATIQSKMMSLGGGI